MLVFASHPNDLDAQAERLPLGGYPVISTRLPVFTAALLRALELGAVDCVGKPTTATGTAEAFHRDGFDVHVVALAVPPQVSRAATLSRYYETLGTEQNRWTPPATTTRPTTTACPSCCNCWARRESS